MGLLSGRTMLARGATPGALRWASPGATPGASGGRGSRGFVAGSLGRGGAHTARRYPALRAAGAGPRKANAPARRTRAWTPPGADTGTVKQLGTPARAARSRGTFGHRAQGTATADGLWLVFKNS